MSLKERRSGSLLLAEGADECDLAKTILRNIGDLDVYCNDVGGDSGLRTVNVKAALKSGPKVTRLLIVRDAEGSAANRIESCQNVFRRVGFPVPSGNLEHESDADGRHSGIAVLPWTDDKGAMEDVCLGIVQSEVALARVDELLHSVREAGVFAPKDERTHQKARVQAYQAAMTTDKVLHRCGQGLGKGYYRLDDESLAPLAKLFREVFL